MQLFDFHHHHAQTFGIYNLNLNETPPVKPFSTGIHPKDIDENTELVFERIQSQSLMKNCFAIGECGLDGLIEVEEKRQEEVFRMHIIWANEIKKPLIVHCVRRFSEVLKFKKMAHVQMVIHGFNKKNTIAKELIHEGFYLSFGKALLHNVSLQQTLQEIPMEKIFLETDDDLVNIAEIYQKVSEIKGISLENVHAQILKNLENIIRI